MGRKPNASKLLQNLPLTDNNLSIEGTPAPRSAKVPMEDNNVGKDGTPTSRPSKYQTMYLDGLKKIEDLTHENRLLAGKLEIALGKVEVVDDLTKENQALSGKLENTLGKVEAMENQISYLKELIERMINGLTKSGEASGTKRKRDDQES